MKLLEVKKLSKKFNNEVVLKEISFNLKKGETLGILGSSGGGKTTILRCLNLLEEADSAQFFINNKLIYDASNKNIKEDEKRKIRSHFGLVFQGFNLFPQYSVIENITLALNILKIDNASSIAEDYLKRLDLENKKDAYPEELSGGQKQRVAIARALALKPDILCFDEPTSALDPYLTNEVSKVINDLKKQQQSMIVVSHDMNFIRKVADRVILILDGKIIEEANTEDFFKKPKQNETKEFLNSSKE